jgi:hypothetical protein
VEQSKIRTTYLGGPEDGLQDDYVQGCREILCGSTVSDRRHRYVLAGFEDGKAVYVHQGVNQEK